MFNESRPVEVSAAFVATDGDGLTIAVGIRVRLPRESESRRHTPPVPIRLRQVAAATPFRAGRSDERKE